MAQAYLLTRSWRDTATGIELSFWGAASTGPIHVIIESQRAVCFIERDQPMPLSPGMQRKPLALKDLNGNDVDALYFRHQRDLTALRKAGATLCESDVKPADRFLMERFIRTGFDAEGELELRDGIQTLVNPRMKPCDVSVTPRCVAIDIETRGSSRTLYSIAAAQLIEPPCDERADGTTPLADPANPSAIALPPPAVVFMIGDGPTMQREGYELHFCRDEREVLTRFFEWVQQIDPDIITGWAVINFDLNFIDMKCRSLGMRFDLGRGGEPAAILQPGNPGSPRIARLPGRAVMDGIDLLKAGFWTFDSFSLDNVAHELLGVGKLITPEQDKVAEINRLFRDDKPQLADYNLRDCTLVNEIFIKADLIAFAVQRANLTGLAVDRLGGAVAAFDNLYLPHLHRRGHVAPDVQDHRDAIASPGGQVLDSVPGLYENVLVLDFKSLYPSIIRTFLIDPLGLAVPGRNPVPGFLDARFSRNESILPTLVESLWEARDDAKRLQDAPLSQAIKIIMNSLYGVLGSTGCRFFSPQLASSITRRGHEIINDSRDWIENEGHQVIYGDTDSLFVLVGGATESLAADAIGTTLTQGLNLYWQQELDTRFALKSHLEVEFETRYSRFLMPTVRGMPTGSKKRYAGLVDALDGGEPKLVVKGLEAARTDWTPLARDFQRELFRRVFLQQSFDGYIRTIATRLLEAELDEALVYRKRLRRKVDDYQRNVPPHVQAARKLKQAGKPVGNWIRYVITVNGPEPVALQQSAIDYQHYLDKQLAPAADGILQFLDTRFSAITDAQLQMF